MSVISAPDFLSTKSQIRASDLPFVLDQYDDKITTLSLDCFDTLLWRKTATPKDIFYVLQQRPLFQTFGITAHQRMRAAARAYRAKFAAEGIREVTLKDIYQLFVTLTPEQQEQLITEELLVENEMCYAFPPVVELLKKAHARGLKIIIVSDTYFNETELRALLQNHLTSDVFNMIAHIFCSSEYGKSKKEGLFAKVLETLSQQPGSLLHIGDHSVADFDAPRLLGMHALHFIQFDNKTNEVLRLQHAFTPLSTLADSFAQYHRSGCFNPFRGLFATQSIDSSQSLIGYLTFGPILFAFAHFIHNEIAELQRIGKRIKVFFLLRDAYLLYKACEAYAGTPLGELVRIRKFVSVAASFRTRADVDDYLSSLEPQYYNFAVICEQLLLPKELTIDLIKKSNSSLNPQQTFNELIHQEEILKLIFQQSAAYRERLIRYIKKEMKLETGDTIVLVDTGYIGVTQHFLTRALKDELDVDVIGRYFIASHDPNRPPSKALMTSALCDHGLFEQSCTYKEGCVLDYDNEGNPIFDQIRLRDEQYEKIAAIQSECIRFIHDAKKFFATNNISLSFPMLQETAVAALRRHIYLPTAFEADYFQGFQHDKDMGLDQSKTMYNVKKGLSKLREHPVSFHMNPYETRAANLELALSSMANRIFNFDITAEDVSLLRENLKIIVLRGTNMSQISVNALPTHDGYFSLSITANDNAHLGIMFGQNYQWVQIESVKLLNNTQGTVFENNLVFNQMNLKNGNLYECLSETSYLMIMPLPINNPIYQIVFRPVVRLTND